MSVLTWDTVGYIGFHHHSCPTVTPHPQVEVELREEEGKKKKAHPGYPSSDASHIVHLDSMARVVRTRYHLTEGSAAVAAAAAGYTLKGGTETRRA